MNLSRRQIALLKMINNWKNRNPNIQDVLNQLRSLPLHIVLIILVIIFREYFGGYYLLLTGLILGALARDIGFALRQKETWVLLKEIIQWENVDNLINGTKK